MLFLADLRVALRSLTNSPAFTLTAILILALGLGANTAIFSLVESVLLRPLPFTQPEQLVALWELVPDDDGRIRRSRVTAGNYFDWKAESSSFQGMALFGSAGFNWTGAGDPEQLLGARLGRRRTRLEGTVRVAGAAPGLQHHRGAA